MAISYDEAVGALASALTFGIHPSLEAITLLCDAMDRPQGSFASVQVTGTNGKTSVTRMVAALLREQGARAGCYTSPHLDDYVERIEVDGVPVTRELFAAGVGAALRAARDAGIAAPTEFELLTAAGLWVFRETGVEWAVLEVGMGGRWDATSVVDAAVAVITGVGLDHTAHLGSTREQIAADKAHIIRAGSRAVLGPGTDGVEHVLLERARGVGAHAYAVREKRSPSPVDEKMTVRFRTGGCDAPHGSVCVRIDTRDAAYEDIVLPGPAYQAGNAATAVAVAEAALGVPPDPATVRRALRGFRVPARFETVATDPRVIVDGSHNPQAAGVLATAIAEELGGDRPVVVLGVLADKDAHGIIEALAPVAGGWIVTSPDSERALPPDALGAVVREVTGAQARVVPDVADAVRAAVAAGGAPVVVTGSLVTAAQARRVFG